MTIEEYLQVLRKHDHQMARRVVYSVTGIFVFLAIAGALRACAPLLADICAPILIFLIGLPLMLFGFRRADLTYRCFSNLICPHCDQSLARSKSVVIATGNCPNCGRRVLRDDRIGTL